MTRLLVAGLLLAGCLGPVASLHPPGAGESTLPVWVIGHGWHVGLAMRRSDVTPEVWPEARALGSPAYVEVGWGDGEFYPAGEGTTGLALRAVFGSDSSVLHVVAFDAPVTAFFPQSPIIEVHLGRRAFDALGRFVHQTYARSADGRPLPIAPALYGHGWFYRATGRYGLLTNSNTWAARALREAGCPITPFWSVTAANVLWQAGRFGRVINNMGGPDMAPHTPHAEAARSRRSGERVTEHGPIARKRPRDPGRSSKAVALLDILTRS